MTFWMSVPKPSHGNAANHLPLQPVIGDGDACLAVWGAKQHKLIDSGSALGVIVKVSRAGAKA